MTSEELNTPVINEHRPFEELLEERRRAWAAPVEAVTPLAVQAFSEPSGQLVLEDTVELPRYRPERL